VEIETRHLQIYQWLGLIQNFQSPQATWLYILPHPTTLAKLEQLGKPSVLETFDHDFIIVAVIVTVSTFLTKKSSDFKSG
jgi:hypothetical protein